MQNNTSNTTTIDINAKQKHSFNKLAKEIDEFMESFGSICLSTINKDNNVTCTYAPLIQTKLGKYIYISEAAEHFLNIKNNPKNIEIMFLEDECKAESVILRKRLRFRCDASFIERDSKIFNEILDEFERQNARNSEIKIIRNMLDFHLIRLDFKNGRFVKGFGAAYDIINNEIIFAGNSGKPHRNMPHKNA